MFQIDVFNLIPKVLKQKAIDTTVDFVVNLGKGYLSEEITRRIRKLRSDGEFQEAFEDGLQRAANRFVEEYIDTDEDLVEAISNDKTFFQNEDVQKALLAILKKPGVYSADEQEIVIGSFDSILVERRNRERVNQAVIFFLKCLAEEVWNLPELRPIYELQFQRMTAEAVREQVAIQKAQLQADIALSTDIREALLQLTDTIAEHKLLSNGDVLTLPAPQKVRHNLPQPDYEQFIGRVTELKQIRQLLLPYPKSRHFVITIDGIGGIGKSALALEVSDSYRRHFDKLPEEERFEAIIWTTAKQTILTGERIITRPQSLRTLEDIYNIIATTLKREDITRSPINEQDNLIRQALTQQRTLLIIDNLETVDDERVLSFVRELPAPTKVIVTTRHRLDVAYPIRVLGMTEEEGLELIANEAKVRDVVLTNDEAKRLFNRTGGVPLAIVWSVAQMGFGYGVDSVLSRLGQPASDIAKFCFEATIEYIREKPAYKLLMALSLFATGASREAIGYVAHLSELDRDDGLVSLEKLSLVNKTGNRFELLPLTLTYSNAELTKAIDLEPTLRDRWVEFFLNFLYDQNLKNRYESVSNIASEAENILSTMDWCWHANRLDKFTTFAVNMIGYLWTTGNWSAWNNYIELGLKATALMEDKATQAQFLYSLATMKNYQDDLDEAQKLIKQAINIYEVINNRDRLTLSLHRLGTIQFENNETIKARTTLDKALKIASEIGNEKRVNEIQRKLADIDITEKKYDSAETRLAQVRGFHEKNPGLAILEAYTYRLSGKIALCKQDYGLANQYFQRSLEVGYKTNSLHHIAEAKQSLAELELKLGNPHKAKQLALDAVDIFSKLGMRRQLKETQSLLKLVEVE